MNENTFPQQPKIWEQFLYNVRPDQWSDLAVVGAVILALLLGLWLRNSTLYGTADFAFDNLGISGRYPQHWIKDFGDDPLLRVRAQQGNPFESEIAVRQRALDAEASAAIVLDALALERASNAAVYQTLKTETVLVHKNTATQRTFTYVHTHDNPYLKRTPVLVRGVDVAIRHGDHVLIVTYLAETDNFNSDYGHFRTFIEGLDF